MKKLILSMLVLSTFGLNAWHTVIKNKTGLDLEVVYNDTKVEIDKNVEKMKVSEEISSFAVKYLAPEGIKADVIPQGKIDCGKVCEDIKNKEYIEYTISRDGKDSKKLIIDVVKVKKGPLAWLWPF